MIDVGLQKQQSIQFQHISLLVDLDCHNILK